MCVCVYVCVCVCMNYVGACGISVRVFYQFPPFTAQCCVTRCLSSTVASIIALTW